MQSSASERRRKPSTKRRLIASDDDDDDDEQRHSIAALSSPPGTSSLRGHSHTMDGDSDFEAGPEQLFTNSAPEPSSRIKKKKVKDGPPPTKKKRLHVLENSDEDFHLDASGDDDDGGIRPSKPTAKVRAKAGKAKGSFDGQGQSGGTKRSRASSRTYDVTIDVVGDLDNTKPDTPVLSPPRDLSPPPKKRKLPTIKKNKPAGAIGAAGSSLSLKPSSSSTAAAKSTLPILSDASKPPTRMTPAMLGNTDFDLRNENVYKSLFKAPGGNTPGTGRRDKDERRKELDKMRDDARAKRLAETTSSFDLQAQADKIARFDERLKETKSSALWPNFLAAKWRQMWEIERMRGKEVLPTQEGRHWPMEPGETEEGEMNETSES
ncbi:hypothetical protein H0H81_008118 [Sphagnurus paluster]|uniref:Uncharacterized protein n=1 Tax=Sphagnurus paluster TaxID=117069 RepID=A0A9P7GRB5_9AGAR|nr:hypothetical protein H0H81_008118 [Sphagnurus paluster]